MSVPAQQKEARAGGTGRGLGWAWGPLPTPQSGQVATSAAPVSSLPDTENSNLSGDKGLGWFLSSSSWKGINWHRSCVHVPSYTTCDTERGMHKAGLQSLWATHVVRPVREEGGSQGPRPCPLPAHRPPRNAPFLLSGPGVPSAHKPGVAVYPSACHQEQRWVLPHSKGA